MAKSKNRHDIMENIEDRFLDDPEEELVGDEEIAHEAAEADEASALRAEVAELKDRLLRALADVENIRKRADRDRRDAEIYGATRLARDLLSVHDNFDRALGNVTDSVRSAAPGLIEGIELTQRELLSAFEKNRIVKITPEAGDRFDPKLHQAMFEAPVPGTKAGDIIQVMGVGFTIGDRLLRPAQVGVSSGGPAVAKPVPETPQPDGDA
jgi:molecular chaperone GrpE